MAAMIVLIRIMILIMTVIFSRIITITVKAKRSTMITKATAGITGIIRNRSIMVIMCGIIITAIKHIFTIIMITAKISNIIKTSIITKIMTAIITITIMAIRHIVTIIMITDIMTVIKHITAILTITAKTSGMATTGITIKIMMAITNASSNIKAMTGTAITTASPSIIVY